MLPRFNAERAAYGAKQEVNLLKRLSCVLDESLTKFPERYSVFDFESEHYLVELKSRRAPATPSKFNTWLLPVCKGEAARRSPKTVLFFYHWEVDDSLSFLEYNEDEFDSFHQEVPSFHADKQAHYYIPRDCWSRVELTDSIVFT